MLCFMKSIFVQGFHTFSKEKKTLDRKFMNNRVASLMFSKQYKSESSSPLYINLESKFEHQLDPLVVATIDII